MSRFLEIVYAVVAMLVTGLMALGFAFMVGVLFWQVPNLLIVLFMFGLSVWALNRVLTRP